MSWPTRNNLYKTAPITTKATSQTIKKKRESRVITSEGGKKLVQITIDTDGSRGDKTGTVIATDQHPFWSEDQGHWFNAKDLHTGMRVRTSYGDKLEILSTSTYHRSNQRVHNLSIDGIRTYHVAVAALNILVHNGPLRPDNCAWGIGTGRAPDAKSKKNPPTREPTRTAML
ncbi:polymorphic toxin-type HINT domain-containing protein [Sphaerimonospora mesophila]|uniref:polymorphic toxin-type HINT domain-containing protein n=1 Tax=Sphaerimonospora mesophila TaxID=37483 RepID=UPI0013651AE0